MESARWRQKSSLGCYKGVYYPPFLKSIITFSEKFNIVWNIGQIGWEKVSSSYTLSDLQRQGSTIATLGTQSIPLFPKDKPISTAI